jgi:nucleotide-binding universal stress UspA family protein
MRFSSETIKKILIPTDGSDSSIHAAEYGISIAKMHEAQIIVVNVMDTFVIDRFSKVTERKVVEQELNDDGRRHINYVLGLAEKSSVKATWLIEKGRPFEHIVRLANSLDVDLIVMGTYGRRGVEKMAIGSVSERVIEYSKCPVIVVK